MLERIRCELSELKKDIIFYCDTETVDIDNLPLLSKTDIYIPPLVDINNDNIRIHYNMEG